MIITIIVSTKETMDELFDTIMANELACGNKGLFLAEKEEDYDGYEGAKGREYLGRLDHNKISYGVIKGGFKFFALPFSVDGINHFQLFFQEFYSHKIKTWISCYDNDEALLRASPVTREQEEFLTALYNNRPVKPVEIKSEHCPKKEELIGKFANRYINN